MPVYEYECGACGHQFEEWQKITDKPVRTCPKCKAKKVERLISQTAFHLKGGGWYSDLYSTNKKSSPAPEGGGPGDKGESKGESKASGEKTADKPASTPTAETPKKKKKDGGSKAAAA